MVILVNPVAHYIQIPTSNNTPGRNIVKAIHGKRSYLGIDLFTIYSYNKIGDYATHGGVAASPRTF